MLNNNETSSQRRDERFAKWVASLFLCFFFQAEDGIRVVAVTGVQTCALPIWEDLGVALAASTRSSPSATNSPSLSRQRRRSEERRVGKECRSRRPRNHEKKKMYNGPYLIQRDIHYKKQLSLASPTATIVSNKE